MDGTLETLVVMGIGFAIGFFFAKFINVEVGA
jgi:hypothetical protein